LVVRSEMRLAGDGLRYPRCVAARQVGNAFGWCVGCALAPLLLGGMFGPAWIAIGIACSVVATSWLLLWLPRSAHRAFEAARYATALRRYRWIGALSFSVGRSRLAVLSQAACHLAAGSPEMAQPLLAGVDETALDQAERAVWLNNRATADL